MPDDQEALSDEYRSELYANYVAERRDAEQAATEIAARYEKLLSLISGGALALSLTFVKDIAPDPSLLQRLMLLVSWIALVLSIICMLMAIHDGQNAVREKMRIMDEEVEARINDRAYERPINPYVAKTRRRSLFSLWSTIAGLVFLAVFASMSFNP